MAAVRLQEMTWEEFAERVKTANGTVILPVGSTEQHGPHLPVGTDTMVACGLAEAAAERTGAIVAPPLWFGWSPHHMALPGTITARPEVLLELVYDVIQSLAEHGCQHFILLNGHRIVNVPWLQIAAERAQRQLKVRVVIFDPAYMSRDVADELGFGALGHAEDIESSHMWHMHPELYHAERALDFVPVANPVYKVDPRAGGDTLCYVPSTREQMAASVAAAKGTSGAATQASAEKGQAYHEHLVQRLVEVVEGFRA